MRKRTIISMLGAMILGISAYAQEETFHPTDKWPYIYEQFKQGNVTQLNSSALAGEYNICIDNGTIHFIDNGVILEAEMKNIVSAVIGATKYVNVNGKMMEVLNENSNGYVVKERKIGTETGTDIGFGIKTENFSASNVDLATITALGDYFVHAKVAEVAQEKQYGTRLPVEETLFLRTTDGFSLKATKSEFQEYAGKEESKNFLKENKIKWNSPESLLRVVDYLKTGK